MSKALAGQTPSVDSNLLLPTQQKERIITLDVVRGFAILGILVLNIQSFAMPSAAYTNPNTYGDLSGVNYYVWYFSQLFFDMKFNTIFATLYGAGIMMLSQRSLQQSANGLVESRQRFYHRSFWLLVIGMIHAYIFWYGDILVSYAITGMLIFFSRHWSTKSLLITGSALIGFGLLITVTLGYSLPYWSDTELQDMKSYWAPSAADIAAEVQAYQGSWSEQMEKRLPSTIMMQTQGFFMLLLWRTAGLMMIGMALIKSGFLTGKLDKKIYLLTLLPGLLIGLPLIAFGIEQNLANNFSMEYSMFFGMLPNLTGSLLLSLSYISILLLLVNAGLVQIISRSFARIGQMALSNYLLQTLICTTLFYGTGFGKFGTFERSEQALTVLMIWGFSAVSSKLWLTRCYYGPFEWFWRSLTYQQAQRLVRDSKI